jgi:HAD superfamily phosphoserine phosphatase-like hydrolase
MESADAASVLLVMDFDGTITTEDCLRSLLARHVPAMPELEQAVSEHRLSEAQMLVRGVSLVDLPKEQLTNDFAALATLRPGFEEFLARHLSRGGRAAVLSLGFAGGIQVVWRREHLPPVPMLVSSLSGDPGSGYHLQVDQRFGNCPVCGQGMCKGPAVEALRQPGDIVVAFGDGARDLCMARAADVVFARARLAELCELEGIPFRPLTDYLAAMGYLEERLAPSREEPYSSQ